MSPPPLQVGDKLYGDTVQFTTTEPAMPNDPVVFDGPPINNVFAEGTFVPDNKHVAEVTIVPVLLKLAIKLIK